MGVDACIKYAAKANKKTISIEKDGRETSKMQKNCYATPCC